MSDPGWMAEFGMNLEAIQPFCTPPSASRVTAHMVADENFSDELFRVYEV